MAGDKLPIGRERRVCVSPIFLLSRRELESEWSAEAALVPNLCPAFALFMCRGKFKTAALEGVALIGPDVSSIQAFSVDGSSIIKLFPNLVTF